MIHYELSGLESGPVIACAHCLAGDMSIWDPQMAALEKKFRVLRYDIRGHGRSSAPDGAYSMKMLAADAVGLLDELGIDAVHFMGISLGGMIAQTLALMHPERVLSLILCDTTSIVPQSMKPVWEERIKTAREKGMSATVEETLERWFSPAFRDNNPEITGKIREIILKTPVSGYVGCSRAISNFDIKERLPEISVPALIMVGEKDPGTPVEAARQIHKGIEWSVMLELPGAYHLSNIEAADLFNENLLAFLSRQ
jgi:3-oxoadipate enol-lactonase